MVEKITNKDLEDYANKVKEDIKYGKNELILDSALNKMPENNDISIVAMKISLIDITNGTNLSRNLGTADGLYKLAKKITQIDFDNRVKAGDLSLVEELARWTKENIGKNLFSFISKYCLYHNVHCYKKDDYAIFDSVLCNNLYKYITSDNYFKITKEKLYKNSFYKMKDKYSYKKYMDILNFIIDNNGITIDRPHRKLDWFIWYKNK